MHPRHTHNPRIGLALLQELSVQMTRVGMQMGCGDEVNWQSVIHSCPFSDRLVLLVLIPVDGWDCTASKGLPSLFTL